MGRQLRSLAGQVVAITGGGRGIGRATAAALIAKGARVAIGDIDAPLAERTASELGSGTVGLPLDVTDKASFTSFLDEVESRLGPLDVLVNNAGIMPIGPFVDESDAATEKARRHQHHGRDHRLEAGAPALPPRGRGHIVQLASIAGKAASPVAPPTARPSTPSSASPRRSGPSSAARGSRSTRCCRSASTPSCTPASRRRAASRRPSPSTSPTRSSSCSRPAVRDLRPASDRRPSCACGADAPPDHRGGRPDHQGRPGAAERRPERPRRLRRPHGPDVRGPGGPRSPCRDREKDAA